MSLELKSSEAKASLPWWTWVAPFFIFQLGTQLSLFFQFESVGSSSFYFPTPFALVLIFWWGPRVLAGFYINAVLSAGLWGLTKWYFWPLYGLPETIYPLMSWYFFAQVGRGKYWVPDTKEFLNFLIWAIFIPLVIYKFFLEALFVSLGDRPPILFFPILIKTFLGEFISNFGLSLPLLYFFSASIQAGRLAQARERIPHPGIAIRSKSVFFFVEVTVILLTLLMLSFILDFEKFWFVYGVVSLYTAIRFGFQAAILANLYIFFITYMLPSWIQAGSGLHPIGSSVVNIYIGNSLLYVFAAITGRVISDLRIADERLQQKNQELEEANKELDHFVYSASHDLSAPLKSIRGLVNISLLEENPSVLKGYFSKIETSVTKLELFIHEVLDYSRNKRVDVVLEQVQLNSLFSEILENLRYIEGFQKIKIDLTGILINEFKTDRMRLKIIMNNFLSNAIKFQKKTSLHEPSIRIFASLENSALKITVQDNGEGIRKELIHDIYKMFFRATQNTTGSGLGLYIAKDAANKLGGTIFVESEYGVGSAFTLVIRQISESGGSDNERNSYK